MKQKRSFVNCCLCACPTLINKWGDDERHRYKAWKWMYPWAFAHMHMKVHNKQRAAAFAIISPWGSRSPDRKASVWKSIFTFHMHHKTLRHKFFFKCLPWNMQVCQVISLLMPHYKYLFSSSKCSGSCSMIAFFLFFFVLDAWIIDIIKNYSSTFGIINFWIFLYIGS